MVNLDSTPRPVVLTPPIDLPPWPASGPFCSLEALAFPLESFTIPIPVREPSPSWLELLGQR
jgi:hypothetical protein